MIVGEGTYCFWTDCYLPESPLKKKTVKEL